MTFSDKRASKHSNSLVGCTCYTNVDWMKQKGYLRSQSSNGKKKSKPLLIQNQNIREGEVQMTHSYFEEETKPAKWETRFITLSETHLHIFRKSTDVLPKQSLYLFLEDEHMPSIICSEQNNQRKTSLWRAYSSQNSLMDSKDHEVIVLEGLNSEKNERNQERYYFKGCSVSCSGEWLNALNDLLAVAQKPSINTKNQDAVEAKFLSDENIVDSLEDFFSSSFDRKESTSEWLLRTLDTWSIPLARRVFNLNEITAGPCRYATNFNGMRILESSSVATSWSTCSSPCIQASIIVEGTPDDVLDLLLDVKKYPSWDHQVAATAHVESLGNNTDVVQTCFHAISLGPLWAFPRDLCLMRKWFTQDSGTRVLLLRSVSNSKCPPSETFIRAQIHIACYIMSPSKQVDSGKETTHVKYLLKIDPFGWIPSLGGLKHTFAHQLMGRLLAIRDYMHTKNYVDLSLPLISTLDSFLSPMARINLDSSESSSDEIVEQAGSNNRNSNGKGLGRDAHICDPMLEEEVPSTIPILRSIPSLLLSSMWGDSDATLFKVRGENYLKDKVKVESKEAAFTVVAVDLFLAPDKKIEHIAAHHSNRIYKLQPKTGDGPIEPSNFTVILNFQVPGPPFHSLVVYFQPNEAQAMISEPMQKLLHDFRTKDDYYRNRRMKLIPRVIDGSWLLRQGVGDTPVILGAKLSQKYFVGEHYLEIDCDVGSSKVASYVCQMAKGQAKHLVIDLALLLEGQQPEELPEQILGCVRLSNVDMECATPFPVD